MTAKTYSVRISQGAPDLTSEQASAWLEEQLARGAPLADDPGAGDKTLRLTLDVDKTKQAAQAAGESEAAFLRRLIATRADAKPEPREAEKETEEKPRPRPAVLPMRLRLRPEQVAPFVNAFDHTQAWVISKVMRTPDARAAARYTQEERTQVAEAGVELLNRRAPAWLAENIDIAGFVSLVVSIEFRKIDAARELAERVRPREAKSARVITVPPQPQNPATQPVEPECTCASGAPVGENHNGFCPRYREAPL